MPKKKKKKSKGLSPQEIQKMNRDNIDYQMKVMPILQFDDMKGNSDKMFSGLMGNIMPVAQGLIDMGNASSNANPVMAMFGGQEAQATPSLTDILAQMQPQQPEQPQQPVGPSTRPAQPQQTPYPYNITPEKLAAVRRHRGGRGGMV